MSAASVLPAVKAAAQEAKQNLITLATVDCGSPLYAAATEDVEFKHCQLTLKSAPAKTESFVAILKRNGNQPVEATAGTTPHLNPQTGHVTRSARCSPK